jgi:hypothetical protein
MNMQQDMQQSLRQSFWTRNFLINPLYLIGSLVVVAVYIILPIYLYTNRLKDVCCPPDSGTKLECNSTGGPAVVVGTDGAPADATGDAPGTNSGASALRRMLGVGIHDLVPSQNGVQGDPWEHMIRHG